MTPRIFLVSILIFVCFFKYETSDHWASAFLMRDKLCTNSHKICCLYASGQCLFLLHFTEPWLVSGFCANNRFGKNDKEYSRFVVSTLVLYGSREKESTNAFFVEIFSFGSLYLVLLLFIRLQWQGIFILLFVPQETSGQFLAWSSAVISSNKDVIISTYFQSCFNLARFT